MLGSRYLLGPLVRDRVQQGIDKVQTSGVLSLSHFRKIMMVETYIDDGRPQITPFFDCTYYMIFATHELYYLVLWSLFIH